MELLNSRKKQIRQGDQVSSEIIDYMAECKQHCHGVQKAGGQVHSVQDGAALQGVQHKQKEAGRLDKEIRFPGIPFLIKRKFCQEGNRVEEKQVLGSVKCKLNSLPLTEHIIDQFNHYSPYYTNKTKSTPF
jgi:hypothetical protein